jgi:hypothetical protein
MLRGLLLLGGTVLSLAFFAMPASAATTSPDGLSGYTKPQLEAALKDAIAQGYAPTSGVASARHDLARTRVAAALPFTGVDLGLIAAGGGALLLLGGGLRRLGQTE